MRFNAMEISNKLRHTASLRFIKCFGTMEAIREKSSLWVSPEDPLPAITSDCMMIAWPVFGRGS